MHAAGPRGLVIEKSRNLVTSSTHSTRPFPTTTCRLILQQVPHRPEVQHLRRWLPQELWSEGLRELPAESVGPDG